MGSALRPWRTELQGNAYPFHGWDQCCFNFRVSSFTQTLMSPLGGLKWLLPTAWRPRFLQEARSGGFSIQTAASIRLHIRYRLFPPLWFPHQLIDVKSTLRLLSQSSQKLFSRTLCLGHHEPLAGCRAMRTEKCWVSTGQGRAVPPPHALPLRRELTCPGSDGSVTCLKCTATERPGQPGPVWLNATPSRCDAPCGVITHEGPSSAPAPPAESPRFPTHHAIHS